ncbi:MAG: hypothetical protein R3C53_22285 [Pirellulaceae bacterium]
MDRSPKDGALLTCRLPMASNAISLTYFLEQCLVASPATNGYVEFVPLSVFLRNEGHFRARMEYLSELGIDPSAGVQYLGVDEMASARLLF